MSIKEHTLQINLKGAPITPNLMATIACEIERAGKYSQDAVIVVKGAAKPMFIGECAYDMGLAAGKAKDYEAQCL